MYRGRFSGWYAFKAERLEKQKEQEEFELQQGYNPFGQQGKPNNVPGKSPPKKEGDPDGKGEKV